MACLYKKFQSNKEVSLHYWHVHDDSSWKSIINSGYLITGDSSSMKLVKLFQINVTLN